MNRYFQIGAGILAGCALIALAAFYWSVPAGDLPTYLPGYEYGVATTHFKHGLAAFILGIFAFVYAWFSSGTKSI